MFFASWTLTFALGALAAPNVATDQSAATPIAARSLASKRAACTGNTADDRSVWCDYDLSTNYYTDGPDTGVTREYYFEITNTTLAPDGKDHIVLAVNGTFPGPTIIADWGDTVVVHVTNGLDINGTSLHFHGIRQNFTNPSDGVPSITQCPTAAGDTKTYTWKATQYGSSWYHSHYALQAFDGVLGGIIIHGPATANYDVDLGNLFLNDWSHLTASQEYSFAQYTGPPTADSGLINGTVMNGTEGAYWEQSVEVGTSYLLRVVNGAADTHFDFSIDNHTLTVIAADFVPIVPYTTDVIAIGMGQRYDVIVTADQSSVASDFWLRAVPDTFCSNNYNPDAIKGIIHYGDSSHTPTTSAWTYPENNCANEPSANIVPYLGLTASSACESCTDDIVTLVGGDADSGVYEKWYLGDVNFVVDWREPTAALIVLDNATSYATSYAVVSVPKKDQWVTLVIESALAIPHPIHLHGHDFFVLASGSGTYDDASAADATLLQTQNPPRRDVQMLPSSGYLVIAWQADNPGVWLAHCHIAWHTDEGFALQFVERRDEIAGLYDAVELEEACGRWEAFQKGIGLVQEDSGI